MKDSAFTKYFPRVSAGAMAFRMQDPLISESISGGNLPVYDPTNPISIYMATEYAYFPGMEFEALEKGRAGYISAVQPVFAGGRIVNGNRLASVGKEASLLKFKMHQDEVLLKTEESYWQIVTLNEKRKTIRKYQDLLDRLSKQVEDSYRAGISLKNDVLKVRQKRSEVELNKSKLENGLNLAVMAYCQYVGIPYSRGLAFRDVIDTAIKPEALKVKSTEAVRNRAEYRLLKLSVKAEELKTEIKLGEYMPEVGIGAGILYTRFDDGKWTDNKMIFASATIPISDWWDAKYSMDERSVREKIEKNNQNDRTELLILQIEKSWRDLEDAWQQLSLSEISRSQAGENLNVSRDSFDNGVVDVSDLLEAQAIAQEAEDRLIEAKANYRISQIRYLQATGRAF